MSGVTVMQCLALSPLSGFESTNWLGLSVHVPRVSLGSSHSPKTSM